MRELLEYLIKSLVSKPETVQIEEEGGEGAINFKLTVAPEDMGLVIGKSGQTIRAIRRLLSARAMAEGSNLRVFVNLNEVPQSEAQPSPEVA